MPKRLHQGNGPPYPANRHSAWSIGSNGLTAAGQNELLKHIGRQLQADYQDVLKEPAPDRIRDLVRMLESRSDRQDDHADGEDL
ncbi:NepR family anti-sigma factor [Microvirga pakistanensis]|uniref:NepR family anti-sigma factor n=1 Tax=Microvirga pakistanensis TaxID=1682650 RepID=UPI001069BDC8|nr:NepR family anti-sigma factor [Microvirga pakistanensis]